MAPRLSTQGRVGTAQGPGRSVRGIASQSKQIRQGCLLCDDGGGSEGFGWHRPVEAPGDRDRAIAGVADVLPSSQEEVGGGAELVDLVLPGKEQDGAAFTSVIDVTLPS